MADDWFENAGFVNVLLRKTLGGFPMCQCYCVEANMSVVLLCSFEV